jgi:hypothetical protein
MLMALALDPLAAKELGLEVAGLASYDRQNWGHDRAGLAVFRNLRSAEGIPFPSAFIQADRLAVQQLVSAITGHPIVHPAANASCGMLARSPDDP